jgi:alpha-galactosidase
MLEVGNGGKTLNEDRAHFLMWCILAVPLIAGNDLTNTSKETMEILTTKDAINQDAPPRQPFNISPALLFLYL